MAFLPDGHCDCGCHGQCDLRTRSARGMGRDHRFRGALEAVAKADEFIFGSLATRSPYNLEQLDRLLSLKGP